MPPALTPAELNALAREAQQRGDLGPLYKAVWRLIAKGDPENVAELVADTARAAPADPQSWAYRMFCDYLPSAPREDMAEVLFNHLVHDAPTEHVLRRAAEMLEVGQPGPVIEGWLERHLPDPQALPVLALLAHTLVLSGWHGADTTLGQSVRRALRRAHHPLGALPISLHEIERDLPRRNYTYRLGRLGTESMAAVGTAFGGEALNSDPSDEASSFIRLRASSDEAALLAPFQLWEEESNAQLEAGVFQFAWQISRLSPNVLGRLPLASVSGTDTVKVRSASPREVFGQLFIGGAAGGAYGGALYGATARLAAWRSLGALVGVPLAQDMHALLAAARESELAWYSDEASSFFYGVFDFAAACLRSDGRIVVILAATDTD